MMIKGVKIAQFTMIYVGNRSHAYKKTVGSAPTLHKHLR